MVEKEINMTNTNNRPGNMENTYENRKTLEYGKIISYNDRFMTMNIALSDGTTKTITYGTFKSTWRKKAVAAEKTVEETNDDEYVAEIMQQKKDLGIEVPEINPEEVEIVERHLVPMPGIEKLEELKKEYTKKPAKKAGKPRTMIEYDGRSQGICAWARELNMNANTLYNRIYYKHMSFEEAIAMPTKKN